MEKYRQYFFTSHQLRLHLTNITTFVMIILVIAFCFLGNSLANTSIDFKTSLLVDPAGTLTIDEVVTKSFVNVPHTISRGYTTSISWLKIELPQGRTGRHVLRVKPVYLDNVQLYSPSLDSGWLVKKAGDYIAFVEKERPDLGIAFNIDLNFKSSQTHYIRLETTSSSLISLSILSELDTRISDELTYLFLGVYAGLMGYQVCGSLLRFFMTKGGVWLVGALFQFISILGIFVMTGFTAKFIWPDTPLISDALIGYGAIAQIGSGTWFTYLILKSFKPHWLVLWPCPIAIYIIVPLLFFGVALDHMQVSMKINSILIIFIQIWSICSVWFVKPADRLLRYLLRTTHAISAAYLIYYISPLLGLGSLTEQHTQGAWIVSINTGLLGYWLLLRQQHLLNLESIAASKEAAKSRHQLTFEQAKLADARSFLAMLMHEIKTPLSVIRLAALSLRRMIAPGGMSKRLDSIQKSVDSIDTVLQSVSASDMLDQGDVSVQRVELDMASWLQSQASSQLQSERLLLALPDQLFAKIDSILLSLMLQNLIRNALSYSAEGSRVHLSLFKVPEQSQFCLEVANKVGAAGRPDSQRVFTKYYRSVAAQQTIGTGLGLYWVHGLAKLWGGELRYCPPDDAQDTEAPIVFQLRLPC